MMKANIILFFAIAILASSFAFSINFVEASTAQPSLFVTSKQLSINANGYQDSTSTVSLPGGSEIVSLVDNHPPAVSPAYFAINFTGITFQSAQFYLLLSSNGLAQRSAGDIQFAGPFNVADLSSAPKQVNGYYIGFANGTSYISGPIASGEAGGAYYIKVWSGSSAPVLVSLQQVIIQPAITLSPAIGPAGSSLYLTGFGFTPSSTVTITIQNSTISPTKIYYTKNITASQFGNFTWSSSNDSSFIIPDYGKISNSSPVTQPEGIVYLTAYDWGSKTQAQPQTFKEQYREFTSILAYNPNSKSYIAPSGSAPYGNGVFITVYIGSFLNISGNYFNPTKPLNFYLNNTALQPSYLQQVNASGYFVADFRIPIVKVGIYQLRVADSTGNMSILLEVRAVAIPSVAITMSYSVKGGGSGYAPPTINYVAYGIPQSSTLSTTPTTFYMDYNSVWNVSSSLTGSATGEAWNTNQSTTGIATSNTSYSFVYYHQYSVKFDYSVRPSGSVNPIITYTQFGKNRTTTAGNSVWADAGSSCEFMNPISIASNERYYSPDSSCIVTSPGNIQAIYYHQYLVSFPYSISGGGTTYQAPLVSYISLGQNSTSQGNLPVWADAGSNYEYPFYLQGSSSSERWIAQSGSQLNGAVSSAIIQAVTYIHQYYITITASTPQAGSVSPSSGWYNAGSVLSISATPNQGWKFSSWAGSGAGSFSGLSQSSSIVVSSPITETATFDVQLEIISSGWVKYSYATSSGTLNGNNTLYIPLGSEVSLTAYPSSPLYTFSGWHGASNSTSSSITLAINQPSTIAASFSYNYFAISAIAIAIVVIAILFFLFIRRITR
jgi:hypothetical protein